MAGRRLRYGFTTGACAAAAAKGAALMLRDQRLVQEAEIVLPGGERPRFRLHGQEFTECSAACFVVKDAGDDPDVTNGAEVHARVSLAEGEPQIVIEGGAGIGRVTKPGLAVPVGAWAINPVPRRMIEEAIREVFPQQVARGTLRVTVSIPNGAELARRTLNERLGIVGGLSILGTTGIVRPVSAKAWTDTIDTAIDVALAGGCSTVVLSTGRTSELVAERHLVAGEGLPEEAFVMMGDHVGHALRVCAAKGVRDVVVAAQFAKLLKIACGHEQTHVASSELDLRTLLEWVELETRNSELGTLVKRANTAREVLEASGNNPELVGLVCARVREFAERLAPGCDVKVLLAGYDSKVLYFG